MVANTNKPLIRVLNVTQSTQKYMHRTYAYI